MTDDPAGSTMIEGLRTLADGEPLSLRVTGHCMQPVLPPSARIRVLARRRYWPGDILAFRSRQGDLRVHRLIGYRPRGRGLLLHTRADHSATLDAPIAANQVIGRVVGTPEALTVPWRDRLTASARFIYLWLTRGLPE